MNSWKKWIRIQFANQIVKLKSIREKDSEFELDSQKKDSEFELYSLSFSRIYFEFTIFFVNLLPVSRIHYGFTILKI